MLATGGGGWRQDLFEELTGEGLQELWSRYQNFLPKEEGEEQEEEVLYDSDFSQVGEQSGNKKSMNVKYHFRNPTSENPGSLLFTECVPSPVELLKALSERVVKILYAAPPSHYPYFVSSITLILREFDGVAHCQGSKTTKELHLSSSYILDFFKRNNSDKKLLEAELHGILVHELTHCWQWSEKVKQKNISTVVAYEKKPAPGGVIEGVADFSRLSCSLQPAHWKRKKDGSWDEGYATTAYFFDFIQQKMQQHNFVRKLNYMIGLSGWSVVIFKQLTGKTVEELWRLYQQDRD